MFSLGSLAAEVPGLELATRSLLSGEKGCELLEKARILELLGRMSGHCMVCHVLRAGVPTKHPLFN